MSSLSTRPVCTCLPLLDEADRQAMRDVLAGLRSGHGFVTDLSYAGTDYQQTRRTAQQRVTCPTLITASRHDRGVAWAHAEDLAATIPLARPEVLPGPAHLFWIGPPEPTSSAAPATSSRPSGTDPVAPRHASHTPAETNRPRT
jgi:pimeloyl-ACP methyl ester carboxylesterase